MSIHIDKTRKKCYNIKQLRKGKFNNDNFIDRHNHLLNCWVERSG